MFYHINYSYRILNDIQNYKLGWQLSKLLKTIRSTFQRDLHMQLFSTFDSPCIFIRTHVGSIPEALQVHACRIPLNSKFFHCNSKAGAVPNYSSREAAQLQTTDSALTVWKPGFIDPYLYGESFSVKSTARQRPCNFVCLLQLKGSIPTTKQLQN